MLDKMRKKTFATKTESGDENPWKIVEDWFSKGATIYGNLTFVKRWAHAHAD